MDKILLFRVYLDAKPEAINALDAFHKVYFRSYRCFFMVHRLTALKLE